jgi:cell division protein FtsZ
MAIEFTSLELTELKPKVAVIGVGGAGGNAVNNMVETAVQGIDFIAANTDAQALAQSRAKLKIQLGVETTEGLGAGSHPDVGRAAAEEAINQIEDALTGCHMVFITAGMGGGTGTGAAPVIAKAAKAQGILTIAVVTKPFEFEGNRRMKLAEDGIYELQPFVDTLVVIPNQNLFRVANKQTTFAEAFAMADDVLCSGVRGIADLMLHPGLINLDFADIKTIMHNMGTAMLGTGEASGEGRALQAAETAISNPLLDEMSLDSAKGVIINITGGTDLTLFEVDEAANHIRKEVDENANIIVGSAFHGDLEGKMRVSIVATGVTYLKKSRHGTSFTTGDDDEEAKTLHFEVGEDEEGLATTLPVADNEDEKTPSHQAYRTEPVGVVDDFAMPEAAEVEDAALAGGEVEPGAGEELVHAAQEASAPSYQMKEMRAEDNGPFDQAKRRSLFQESIEFVADEEDPPLIEELSTGQPKKSLFGRMAAGIKGVFSGPDEVLEERAEPSMTDFEPEQEGGLETDNILNMEDKMDLPETFEDEAAKEKPAADIEAEDDQLAIPSFLRKQA